MIASADSSVAKRHPGVTVVYEEIPIDEFEFDPDFEPLRTKATEADDCGAIKGVFCYLCPCGDLFEISLHDLIIYNSDICECPSCTLKVRILYEAQELQK
eukprot:Selendium_serpulae@DN2726_c0_g1_i2.p1